MEKIKLLMNKAVQFVSQAKAELKKVVWPTRKQTLASTGVVYGYCCGDGSLSGNY